MKLRSHVLWLGLLTCLPVMAEVTETNVTGLAAGSAERFGRYEDSFFIRNRMQNNGWTGADEWALRAHYSFKYTFCGPQVRAAPSPANASSPASADSTNANTRAAGNSFSICPTSAKWQEVELFAAYTGEFDFYLGTRPSGPVINRTSMPGFFARFPLSWLNDGWRHKTDSLEFGWQHRSDGQVTDVESARGTEAAQAQYAAGNRAYFDTASRGANFFSVAMERHNPLDIPDLTLRAKLLLYAGSEESAVTWGPLAGQRRRFADYDRLELRANYGLTDTLQLQGQWTVGDKGLRTDSWTLGVIWSLGEVPLYLRLHRGPMNTLSNYTQRQDSIGFGLLLARY